MEESLNLDNPIFVYYFNALGLPPADIDHQVNLIQENFKYKNTTIWVVPVYEGFTKIECIYDGRDFLLKKKLNNLIETINKNFELFNDCNDINEYKKLFRNWKLESIL